MSTQTVSLLDQLAKPKKAASKAGTPVLNLPECDERLAELAQLKLAIKDAEARKSALEADLIAIVEPRRLALSRQAGNCIGSVKVGSMTLITFNNNAKRLTADEAAHAQSVLGAHSEKYLLPVYQITVDLMKAPADLLQGLSDIGAEIERTHKIAPALHNDRTLDPNLQALADQCPELKPVRYFK